MKNGFTKIAAALFAAGLSFNLAAANITVALDADQRGLSGQRFLLSRWPDRSDGNHRRIPLDVPSPRLVFGAGVWLRRALWLDHNDAHRGGD